MDDDDAQFLVVELAAGVNCQDLSETLGTQPFEHPNYQWLVLGSTPAAFAVARGVDIKNLYVAHEKGSSQGLLVRPGIQSPRDLAGRTFGTPFGSTAHYHMMYIQTLFPDVSFTLTGCNADCPDLYDAGTIDGAFVWGGVMEKMKGLGATMLVPAKMLSDWEKATFNTISVRDAFAADHSAVVERIAGVVARLDASADAVGVDTLVDIGRGMCGTCALCACFPFTPSDALASSSFAPSSRLFVPSLAARFRSRFDERFVTTKCALESDDFG